MNRSLTILATAAALAGSALFTAGTASAGTVTDTTATTSESDREWQRYRAYANTFLCEATGASGVVLGRWNDWWCDDDNVLWVER